MQEAVGQFNACINAGDIDALAKFMSDDHAFIDSAGNTVQGKRIALTHGVDSSNISQITKTCLSR